ncbi:MAG TPA: orotate phosphoribosyltransferase [Planctomycetaceae bacterium]|jgi:orotate phosphoribosyltransferase|nr:orotate phosphoribosyltransferase [Planctomycetaceae bacterium]
MYDRARLIELFRKHALKFGDFTLASGQKSTYYLDGRLITLHAEGLRLIAQGVLERLAGVDFAAVGGMSIGADPIVGGVLTVAAEQGRPLLGFLVRKQAKEHGTRRAVEGPVEHGSNVVIVEDVITTGGSALDAIDRVEELGCRVTSVVGVCDRLQGGAAAFAARGVPFHTLLTIRDLGIAADG